MKYLMILCLLLSACIKLVPKNEKENKKKTLAAPKQFQSEYVIKGKDIIASENHPLLVNHFDKIIWEDEAILITLGNDLDLSFNQMQLGRDNQIISFEENTTALDGLSGRSGGTIKMTGNSISGFINIIMRGENGGHGLNGAPFERRANDGASGLDTIAKLIKGSYTSPHPDYYECVPQNTDGSDGANGAIGNPGQAGGKGGDAGQIILDIKDISYFRYITSSFPGEGGIGGVGGEGQKGGLGGRAGIAYLEKENKKQFSGLSDEKIYINYLSKNETCRFRNSGKNGSDGLPGANGEMGEKGKNLLVCFTDQSLDLFCNQ